MSERAIKNAPAAIHLRPNNRHLERAVLDVRAIGGREGGRRENANSGVDVHVVLFADDVEIGNVFRNLRIYVAPNIHAIRNAIVARMRDPLAASHELPFGGFAKAIAHSAVAAGNSYSALYSLQHGRELFAHNLSHRENGYEQIEIARMNK